MRSSSRSVMSKVPSNLKQGLAHELANANIITLSDIGGAISAGFEDCVSLIRAKVDVRGDARGLRCHASGLHPQQNHIQNDSTPKPSNLEYPRPLVIARSAIMIVVHFANVSALYPRIVISSLCGRLENHLFAILYTSFGVWLRDHYMPLQR
jgi:hypothetical protein